MMLRMKVGHKRSHRLSIVMDISKIGIKHKLIINIDIFNIIIFNNSYCCVPY